MLIKTTEQGKERTLTFPLNGSLIVLGRGRLRPGFIPLPACAGAYISKVHCSLFTEEGEWWICSGSPGGPPATNGIWLDGLKVEKPQKLSIGQVFVLHSPPPCEVQLHIVEERPSLEDTLTPAIEDWTLAGKEEVKQIKAAIHLLHGQLEENRNLDESFQSKLAHLQAETALASQLFEQFEKDLRQSIRALKSDFAAQQKQQSKSSQQLARVISFLALSIAIFGIISFVADGSKRQDYGEIAVEILLFTLGGGGALATLKERE